MQGGDLLFGLLATAATFSLQCQAVYVTIATRGVRHPPLLCSGAILLTSALWVVYACVARAWFLAVAGGVTIAQQGVIIAYIVLPLNAACNVSLSESSVSSKRGQIVGAQDQPAPAPQAVLAPVSLQI
tara:strand:- start:2159 stop:2542 length:384 start_codon:yes stop_codon:yes gene_type:complete